MRLQGAVFHRHLQNLIHRHDRGLLGGTRYDDWYVGIASDANSRLGWHKARGVPHKTWKASSVAVARAVGQICMRQGFDGGVGGGFDANEAYIYLKSQTFLYKGNYENVERA